MNRRVCITVELTPKQDEALRSDVHLVEIDVRLVPRPTPQLAESLPADYREEVLANYIAARDECGPLPWRYAATVDLAAAVAAASTGRRVF